MGDQTVEMTARDLRLLAEVMGVVDVVTVVVAAHIAESYWSKVITTPRVVD